MGGREIRDDSQGARGVEEPFPEMGRPREEAGWERIATVWGSGELPEPGSGKPEGHGHLEGG